MKMQLLMTSILAFGMGLAQAQNPAPMQSGTDAGRGSAAQTPAGADRTGAPGAASPTGVAEQATGPQSFKGCLTGTAGNWTLASDNGQTLKISGTDDQLSTYNNQQINIHGTQATDGTIKVASIDKISDSCSATGQAATNTGNTEQNTATTSQSPATSSASTQPPASSTTGAMSNQSTTTSNTQSTTSTTASQPPGTGEAAPAQSTTGAQTGTASTTTPSTGTPPVSEQTPSSTVGGNTSDQGAAQQPPSSTTGQGATATGQSATTSGQSGNVPHISDMDQNQPGTAGNQATGQNAGQQKLPQTASPLPLLGLMGLGSLLTGLVARRKK